MTRSAALTLYHPDGVSGTTICDDGTKAHWTEGRSSTVNIQHPDGRQEDITPGRHVGHWYFELEPDGVGRTMTPAEVQEYDAARAG